MDRNLFNEDSNNSILNDSTAVGATLEEGSWDNEGEIQNTNSNNSMRMH